ncbi:MAG: 2-hydroxychromene-2-carboxylate isomerase [Rhodanobacteraceae bacterium]|nr:MAG: 2-hydroxychromene-2-carboxylate isomerase [Rhodanobacteraceae bacterium]
MTTARWYFDPISPYAYLHLKKFGRLPPDLGIEYVPILLAGVLAHWGQKGPAEIVPKRRHAYRQTVWLARQLGIPLQMPPRHPFNSLHALRLLVAAGPTREHVETAFDMAWKDGRDLQSRDALLELGRRLRVEDVESALADAHIKQQLRDNTDEAIRKGVFGVPTFLIDQAMFWGQDSLEMMLDYLRDPGMFDTSEMRRVDSLPVGASRRAQG